MQLVETECRQWGGRETDYQDAAHRELYAADRYAAFPSWVTTTCGTQNCLAVEHMQVTAPTVIRYPHNVCTYCGSPAWTKDHLLPRAWSGDSARKYVAVVPACGECNSGIGDRHGPSISERRAAAHTFLRKKYKAALAGVDHMPSELAEYGPGLRAYIENSMAVKIQTKDRLSWPHDPAYDLRAFQRSGIEDPAALGML